MTVMADAPSETTEHEGAAALRKEAYTMALYVAVCLLAAIAALPEGVHSHAFELIWGVTVGLALAHVFAFRVSARLVGKGTVSGHDAQSAGVQILGAIAVAVLATVPILVLPESWELNAVAYLLAAFIALVGFAVARSSGATMFRSLVYASFVLVGGLVIALLKNLLAGH
jgi:hypothetical protein